jgi:hypothetical protein
MVCFYFLYFGFWEHVTADFELKGVIKQGQTDPKFLQNALFLYFVWEIENDALTLWPVRPCYKRPSWTRAFDFGTFGEIFDKNHFENILSKLLVPKNYVILWCRNWLKCFRSQNDDSYFLTLLLFQCSKSTSKYFVNL